MDRLRDMHAKTSLMGSFEFLMKKKVKVKVKVTGINIFPVIFWEFRFSVMGDGDP